MRPCKQLSLSCLTTACRGDAHAKAQLVAKPCGTVHFSQLQSLCNCCARTRRATNPKQLSQAACVTAMALRRIALVVGLRIAAAYAPPTTRARRSVQLSAKKIDFVTEEESRDFLDVSSVFLDSFWADKAGSQELTSAQRRELRSGQLDDFRRRYALRRDTRRKAHYSWPRTARPSSGVRAWSSTAQLVKTWCPSSRTSRPRAEGERAASPRH